MERSRIIMDILKSIKERIVGKVPLLSKRSSHWETVRKHWLEHNNECAACGVKNDLQVHHVKPFHLDPSLELNFTNFITLCEKKGGFECHLHVGHHGNFKSENPNVREEAAVNRKGHGLADLVIVIPEE